MNPITVGEVTYTSVAQAWRNESPEGLSLTTVRWRLRNEWSAEDALRTPVVPPVERRGFKGQRDAA
jgi:hypothetical protein